MALVQEFTLRSSDGRTGLHGLRWLPEAGEPKAVLQLTHGVAEHLARYDPFARFLADRGWAVTGVDCLGHGGSAAKPEDRGFFADKDGWDLVVRDMRRLYEQESSLRPGLPYFLFGHSMGSFLARTYLIRYPSGLTGCVLSGTGTQPGAVCTLGLLAAGLERLRLGSRGRSKLLDSLSFGSYNRRIPRPRTPNDWLSRDETVVDRYQADESCGFPSTVSLFADMLGGIRFISAKKNLARMQKDLPIYFFSGEEDPVGDYGRGVRAVVDLFRAAGCRDLTLKLYPGGRHEMLNELGREEVYADLLTWLESRLPETSIE